MTVQVLIDMLWLQAIFNFSIKGTESLNFAATQKKTKLDV